MNPAAVYATGSHGYLLDLSGSPWQKRIPPAIRKSLKVKERYLMMPILVSATPLAANMDVLAQAGVKVPTTFAELLASCAKIKAIGKIPFAWGSGTTGLNAVGNWLGSAWVYGADPNWTLKKIQHKVTFAGTPGWKNAFQSIQQMKDAGCFSPAAASTSDQQAYAQLATGQAAYSSGAGGLGTFRAVNPDVKVNLFAWPGPSRKTQRVGISGNGLVVNKATKVPALAKLFVNFMARPAQQALYVKVFGGLTAEQLKTGENLPPEWAPLAPLLKAHQTIISPSALWPNSTYATLLGTQLTGIITGQVTVDQALAYADNLWK